MPPRPTVNVVGVNHGYGLVQDGVLITTLLNEAGFDAVFVDPDCNCGEGLWNRIKARFGRERKKFCDRFLKDWFPKRDLNVFVERIPLNMFHTARQHVLIPNQEWFQMDRQEYLNNFDLVICKTRHAEEIFSKLGCRTAYSSFTSVDRYAPSNTPKRREFLMLTANCSGIPERVLNLWARHPEWPRLTVSGRQIPPGINLPNVVLIRNFISEEEISLLQNSCLFHLCVTPTEGFGHKHNEALSCSAIVLATDAPPMNEIIQPDRGLLAKWDRTNPKALGIEFHFDEADLERMIERCLQLTSQEITTLSANARSWFEKNDLFFRSQLPVILRGVLSSGG